MLIELKFNVDSNPWPCRFTVLYEGGGMVSLVQAQAVQTTSLLESITPNFIHSTSTVSYTAIVYTDSKGPIIYNSFTAQRTHTHFDFETKLIVAPAMISTPFNFRTSSHCTIKPYFSCMYIIVPLHNN